MVVRLITNRLSQSLTHRASDESGRIGQTRTTRPVTSSGLLHTGWRWSSSEHNLATYASGRKNEHMPTLNGMRILARCCPTRTQARPRPPLPDRTPAQSPLCKPCAPHPHTPSESTPHSRRKESQQRVTRDYLAFSAPRSPAVPSAGAPDDRRCSLKNAS